MVVRGIPIATNLPGNNLVPTLCPGGRVRPCARRGGGATLCPGPCAPTYGGKINFAAKVAQSRDFYKGFDENTLRDKFCMKIRSPAVVRTMVSQAIINIWLTIPYKRKVLA